jgi:hypothetical protein
MSALLAVAALMAALAAPGATQVHAEVGPSTARIDADPSRSELDVVVTTKGLVRVSGA